MRNVKYLETAKEVIDFLVSEDKPEGIYLVINGNLIYFSGCTAPYEIDDDITAENLYEVAFEKLGIRLHII
jgi:hypothetical protein